MEVEVEQGGSDNMRREGVMINAILKSISKHQYQQVEPSKNQGEN